jgi:hypothetical protein
MAQDNALAPHPRRPHEACPTPTTFAVFVKVMGLQRWLSVAHGGLSIAHGVKTSHSSEQGVA